MSLLQDYSHDFTSDVRRRGEDYQRNGAVNIIDHSPDFVEAEVEGSDLYRVIVERKNDQATYSCTCPYFEENGRCKHCWAVVLEAQKKGILPGIKPANQQRVEGNDQVEDQDEEGGEEDSDEPGDDLPLPGPLQQFVQNVGAMVHAGPKQRRAALRDAGKKLSGDDRWKAQLKALRESMEFNANTPPKPLSWAPGRRVLYVIHAEQSSDDGLVIRLMHETPRRDGAYEKPRALRLGLWQVAQLPEAVDRQIIQLLNGVSQMDDNFGFYYEPTVPEEFAIDSSAYHEILKLICSTGRCRIQSSEGGKLVPLTWDDGPAWEFCLQIRPSPGGRYLVLDGVFRRAGEAAPATPPVPALTEEPPTDDDDEPVEPESSAAILPLSEPQLLLSGTPDGLIIAREKVSRLRHFDAFPLIDALRDGEKINVPLNNQTDLLKMLLKFPRLPRLELPADLNVSELSPEPRPKLKLVASGGKNGSGNRDALLAKVTFDYDGHLIDRGTAQAAVLLDDGAKLLRRDGQREAMFLAELESLGFREDPHYFGPPGEIRLAMNKMPRAVAELTRRGWTVEAEGKLYRSSVGPINISVSSGIDWFELNGEVTFDGGLRASLPKLLEALRKGENVVRLDDGTFGLLPEEWLKKYAGLASMGETDGDSIKFSARQIGFLDALLSAMPEARFDEQFSRARDELMRFSGVEAFDPPTTFIGTLRQYQREGLGWMAFLRKFGFGGVLADDMGLGKTVQVLALLEARRQMKIDAVPAHVNGENVADQSATPQLAPSLVVAPRSLVFNWKAEATKFAPNLRVLDHTSVDRARTAEHFADYDIVLTTYGTLRRDMSYFKDVKFDYAILDEAQAIKNASSESAKAARLIKADHRLCLSGTPVQNHLGELWSLFDYLNPGMMGSVGVFRDLSADAANKDQTARELLARALRPFILRRTKEQVAKDLPEKLEQTLYCELDKDQRKLYDELRDHYRTNLLERVAREGMNKAKIMVLEALLRLRQAACHPGLIDKERSAEPSAKLDVLLDHLDELVDENHKVLVFSQFTSLLAIVRERLDQRQAVYEYLDGRTKDRQERVNRFQTDPDCKMFLISLKAGGLGLNLTAAEYVFLLDPWWNPAVEAQAIDRAHRIGQTRRVFAYRLIAKDTVEEKVLQLQQSKKDLADAIINADNSLIRTLSREDLEMLLS
jgi:superfamily II DNA or RNA helicase